MRQLLHRLTICYDISLEVDVFQIYQMAHIFNNANLVIGQIDGYKVS